ncbi:MAG: tripartite tricarboxylate transporter substrate binding protein [Rhodocyclaceae bacterium]|nr:tripartite tricarboxylate transporter substrate binding protein [Rhodocyclaceae bacterium]MCA3088810.1 tripartite tricarboxylate transporter substrate binding protein [Rhodocyclaceae bacterium]MCA3092406.1 tripartite tricarboxylate transporter substrate binding protein [Rhodocyclaceae bacterium]MCA3097238.1 tripartite tricarboxylate transporter substrate binding protein [Rhodocyclaceae bacterium]MCA3103853.1 tripartite tricarboxylate transporter substrate binding protein [Rhodocyclaceae bact
MRPTPAQNTERPAPPANVVRRTILCALLATAPAASFAQPAFPSKTIRLIAPFAPGGALDLTARVVGQVLTEQLGQPVIVDNRAGAAGAIGSEQVARAAPDGYTLLLGATTTHGINPVLQQLSYDPIKDFTPVSLVVTIPHVLVVNPTLPVNTLPDLIKYARSKPGLTYGSAGTGSPHHLAGEMLKIATGIDITHVPYKGSAPAMSDVIAGQVQFMSIELTAAVSQLKAGKLRAIAIATAKRVPGVDLPTVGESGVPGFEVTAWYAVYAPARTPRNVVDILSKAIARGLGSGEAREKLASLNAVTIGSTPEELTTHMRSELARWSKVIKTAGVKAE